MTRLLPGERQKKRDAPLFLRPFVGSLSVPVDLSVVSPIVCSSPTESLRRITTGFPRDAVPGLERDSRCQQSSKRDQGCMAPNKKTSRSTGQEQRRMADSRYGSDTNGAPIDPNAAAEVAPSGSEEAEKVEESEEASQQVRKAPPMICPSALLC